MHSTKVYTAKIPFKCGLGTSTKIQEFNPDKDPEGWMRNLHKRYCAQHILIGKVESFKG
jgi:hypothetical protein